jgi:hypothetical protein
MKLRQQLDNFYRRSAIENKQIEEAEKTRRLWDLVDRNRSNKKEIEGGTTFNGFNQSG